jgi:hypothetical protein
MLANFLGVLPILTPPLCVLAFIMCSKSNSWKSLMLIKTCSFILKEFMLTYVPFHIILYILAIEYGKLNI